MSHPYINQVLAFEDSFFEQKLLSFLGPKIIQKIQCMLFENALFTLKNDEVKSILGVKAFCGWNAECVQMLFHHLNVS